MIEGLVGIRGEAEVVKVFTTKTQHNTEGYHWWKFTYHPTRKAAELQIEAYPNTNPEIGERVAVKFEDGTILLLVPEPHMDSDEPPCITLVDEAELEEQIRSCTLDAMSPTAQRLFSASTS